MPAVNPNTDWFLLFEEYLLSDYNESQDSPEELTFSTQFLHYVIEQELLDEEKMKAFVRGHYFAKEFDKEGISKDLAEEKMNLILYR